MERRARGDNTLWRNSKPVADVYELLALLENRQSGRYCDTRYLRPANSGFRPTKCPEVEVDWYHEGSSGGDTGGHDYFEVAPQVAEQAVRERWVEPNVKKYWGGSTVEKDKLVLSELGKVTLNKYIREQMEEAKKLVVPMKHTKYSGLLEPRGYGQEGHDGEGGELYFDFETPMQEKLRVYPKSKRVVDRAKERA